MKLIKNVILFFKRLFYKETSIKMIDAPEEVISKENRNNFLNSIKVDMTKKSKKKKVETLTCFGDGLGIQTKITY